MSTTTPKARKTPAPSGGLKSTLDRYFEITRRGSTFATLFRSID